ncbi:MAG: hypothetical protein R3C26_16310 [Calditrichia bacterium]
MVMCKWSAPPTTNSVSKQQFGNIASLDVTAYYRNVEGLINVTTVRSQFGQTTRTYISTVNQDFGTIKGMAFSFNLRRMGPVTTKIDYALSLSEGTGSDPSSSRVATFRNQTTQCRWLLRRWILTNAIPLPQAWIFDPEITKDRMFWHRVLENLRCDIPD